MALDLRNEVKNKIALSSVVKLAVSLKGDGRKFIGLCPFHAEKTPSFNVRDDVGRFKCFGCGASGDVFEFIMRLRGLSFKEAMRELAEKAGLSLNNQKSRSTMDPATTKEKALLRANSVAHKFFIEQLKAKDAGLNARRYLMKERKLTIPMLEQAALGFGGTSKDEFIAFLKANNVSLDCAIEAGLLIKGQFSVVAPFLGRVIFPIRRIGGNIIAFGGRSFLPTDNDAPKYVNTNASSLYEKRKSFYGLHESHAAILRGQTPYLVEGYFDAMALWAIGLPALALCGTALSVEHCEVLKRLSSRITLCFDADDAGFKALCSALLPLFSHNLATSVVEIDKKDPGEYLACEQLPVLLEKLRQPRDALCFVIERMALNSSSDIAQRIAHIDELLPIVASIARPLVQRQYVAFLAAKLHEDPGLLWMEIKKRSKGKPVAKELMPSSSIKPSLTIEERLLAPLLTKHPALYDDIGAPLKELLHKDFIVHFTNTHGIEDTALAQAIKEACAEGVDLSLNEARAVVLALNEKILVKGRKKALSIKRQSLQRAEKQKNFSLIISSLKEHSEILAHDKKRLPALSKPELDKKVTTRAPIVHITNTLEEMDISEEDGWL